MTAAGRLIATRNQTDLPFVVRASVRLGIAESVLVLLFALVSRFLDGAPEGLLEGAILVAGLTAVTALPGRWLTARSGEEIGTAAGIGLGAAVVFLLVDVALFQPLGLYTNRWTGIGGGSNWWYHPVWWMAATFLAWMGAWMLAIQTARGGSPSVVRMMGSAFGFTALVGVAAIVLHVPGASWTVATFGVAYLPGVALATLVSVLGSRRG